MKPRYSGSRRSKNAENIVSFQKKSGGKKGRMDVRSQKNMDVRSQIGHADQLKTMIFGWPTLQRRDKLVWLEKKWGKGRKWDVQSQNTKDVQSEMERKYRHKTKIFGCHRTWTRQLTMD